MFSDWDISVGPEVDEVSLANLQRRSTRLAR